MLIIEDGSGVPSADSYVSLANANAYHGERGNSAWTGSRASDAAKEAALRRATAYVDALYHDRWPGYRAHRRRQGLAWPRALAYDADGDYILPTEIPVELVQAVCEAATREVANPGSLNPDVTVAKAVKSRTIGPISTEYASTGSPVRDARPILSIVEALLCRVVMPVRYSGTASRG